jgi:hypothetical protein
MTKKSSEQEQLGPEASTATEKITCGIIMPISGSNDTYTSKHWEDVRAIIDEVVVDAGFFPQIVSDANEVGIIHERIVGNIYGNPIVICDVSSKNPNVMFELGLRLAFDKATIIIKDHATNYNFDTSPIEHLEYPADLRYTEILKFKSGLKRKLLATYAASQNPEYSTFLKNFIQYKPKKLEEKEIGGFDLLTKRLDKLTVAVENMATNQNSAVDSRTSSPKRSNGKFSPLFSTLDKQLRETVTKNFYDFLKNESKGKFDKDEAVSAFITQFEMKNPSFYNYYTVNELIDLLNNLFDDAA